MENSILDSSSTKINKTKRTTSNTSCPEMPLAKKPLVDKEQENIVEVDSDYDEELLPGIPEWTKMLLDKVTKRH